MKSFHHTIGWELERKEKLQINLFQNLNDNVSGTRYLIDQRLTPQLGNSTIGHGKD